MIVLGIDTSGYANAVGVTDGNRVLIDIVFPAKTDSLEQIVDNIDSVLKRAGLTLKDVQGIGVGLGPGSWTGIRVGVTVGKMLAFGTGKPVCGVPTLEVLAYAVRDQSSSVWAVISVGTGDAVYAAGYHAKGDELMRVGDYYVGDIKGLATLVKEPCVMVGTGVASWTETIARESGIDVRSMEASPGGVAVACLAAQRLARGESDNALALTPLYLKESTARVFVNKYKGSDR